MPNSAPPAPSPEPSLLSRAEGPPCWADWRTHLCPSASICGYFSGRFPRRPQSLQTRDPKSPQSAPIRRLSPSVHGNVSLSHNILNSVERTASLRAALAPALRQVPGLPPCPFPPPSSPGVYPESERSEVEGPLRLSCPPFRDPSYLRVDTPVLPLPGSLLHRQQHRLSHARGPVDGDDGFERGAVV